MLQQRNLSSVLEEVQLFTLSGQSPILAVPETAKANNPPTSPGGFCNGVGLFHICAKTIQKFLVMERQILRMNLEKNRCGEVYVKIKEDILVGISAPKQNI